LSHDPSSSAIAHNNLLHLESDKLGGNREGGSSYLRPVTHTNFISILFLQADDKSLLARFFHADRSLTAVASELDSFDGRAEPDRCTRLVSRLRQNQVGS